MLAGAERKSSESRDDRVAYQDVIRFIEFLDLVIRIDHGNKELARGVSFERMTKGFRFGTPWLYRCKLNCPQESIGRVELILIGEVKIDPDTGRLPDALVKDGKGRADLIKSFRVCHRDLYPIPRKIGQI
jgi:hypothetical protein